MPSQTFVGSDGSHEECNSQWFIVPEHLEREVLCSGSNTLFPETKLLPAIDESDRRFGTSSAPVKMICEVCEQKVIVFEF